MINNIKVSIIVPIYNGEEYLHDCLNSLIEQSLQEIEIILIDDCSSDQSATICKQYTKKDHRIIFISNKKNLGVGPTRNIGISKSLPDEALAKSGYGWHGLTHKPFAMAQVYD